METDGRNSSIPYTVSQQMPINKLACVNSELFSLQADEHLAAMSRLPRTLAQWTRTSKSAIQSATTQPIPGTRLLHSLQTTFPADGSTLTGTRAALSHSTTAAASNPRIAPYAALPSQSALSLVPPSDKEINHLPGLHSQQAHAKHHVHVKAHRPGRLPKHPSKQVKLNTINSTGTGRPQSAGLRTAGQDMQPAVADRAVKQKPRARSVSPNSQYHFSCTSSVPEDAAAWIAATTDAASRYARSDFELQQKHMPAVTPLL